MKKQLLFLIWLCVISSALFAIEFIPGDGSRVLPEERDYHYSYHNGNNDFQFFGVNKWAVRFNFRAAYPSLTNVQFTVEGARLWFPVPGDSVTIDLMTDVANAPGVLLMRTRIPISQQLMDVPFAQTFTADKLWMVVSYDTNMANRFVSASNGGGNNSYYMSQVGNIQSLTSMATAGFNCEFLFGLKGEFVLDEADLQLTDFGLQGDILPGSRVYPSFTVYNHSDNLIEEAGINITLSRPGHVEYENHIIMLPEPVLPRTSYTFDSFSPGAASILLPIAPSMLRMDAEIFWETAENDTLAANNTRTTYFDIYNDEPAIRLIENFTRTDEAALIHQVQTTDTPPRFHRLLYLPVLSDSLANLASQLRFNWYSFNSVPRVVGSGSQRITGFNNDFSLVYADLIASLNSQKTFISSSSSSMEAVEGTENIAIRINLANANTSLYTTTALNPMSNSRFFVALAKKQHLGTSQIYTMERWIAFADTIVSTLNMGSSMSKQYTFSISGISQSDLVEDYRVYYWVQGAGGGQIHEANTASFTTGLFTSNNDFLVDTPQLSIYPNPFSGNGDITISYSAAKKASMKIYNIRGQQVYQNLAFDTEMKIPASLFSNSGIYFIRIEDTKGKFTTKRISIIK